MALSFLQGAGQILGTLAANRAARRAYSLSQQPTQGELEYKALIDAITNPESAKFKSVYDTQYRRGVDEFIKQLQMITQQSNRQLARGQRSAFFDPERKDESINYLTTRGLPAIQAQAEQAARNNLLTAATGYRNVADDQRARQQSAINYTLSRGAQARTNPFGMFGDILQTINRIPGVGWQTPSQSPTGTAEGAGPLLPWQKPAIFNVFG